MELPSAEIQTDRRYGNENAGLCIVTVLLLDVEGSHIVTMTATGSTASTGLYEFLLDRRNVLRRRKVCTICNTAEQGDIGEKEILFHCRPAEAVVRTWFHTAPGKNVFSIRNMLAG